jgi:6-phosphogluconolactonase (cycloisomerase 2 family)
MAGGALRIVDNVPATGRMAAGAPIDCGVSRDGRNFYALNGNQGSVSAFSIDTNGRLMLLQVLTRTGLPSLGTQGMAVL